MCQANITEFILFYAMTNTMYIHQPEMAVSFTRLPNFLFEAPTFTPLSNEGKLLYAYPAPDRPFPQERLG